MSTDVVGPLWGTAIVAVILVAIFSGLAGRTVLYLETFSIFGGATPRLEDAASCHASVPRR